MEVEENIIKNGSIVRALLTNTAGELLICERPDGRKCLPGGKKDPEDSELIATLKREVFEELGLIVTGQILFGITLRPFKGSIWNSSYYLTSVIQTDIIVPDPLEVLSVQWVNSTSYRNFEFAFENDQVIRSYFQLMS